MLIWHILFIVKCSQWTRPKDNVSCLKLYQRCIEVVRFELQKFIYLVPSFLIYCIPFIFDENVVLVNGSMRFSQMCVLNLWEKISKILFFLLQRKYLIRKIHPCWPLTILNLIWVKIKCHIIYMYINNVMVRWKLWNYAILGYHSNKLLSKSTCIQDVCIKATVFNWLIVHVICGRLH
jgi:hypothetical protein